MPKLAISLALALAAVGFAATQPSPQTPAEWIVEKARQIVHDSKQSVYTHDTDIDAPTGVYKCDCSALLNFILKEVAPDHFKSLSGNRHRPLAINYYQTFANAPTTRPTKTGWQQIERIEDVLPGDVLAWEKLDRKPGDTTGHVVIINSPAMREGDNLVRVQIIDSTTAPHADDTRAKGQSGVGKGTVWFDTDDSGKPVGYHSHNRDAKPMQMPISIGRPIGSETSTQ